MHIQKEAGNQDLSEGGLFPQEHWLKVWEGMGEKIGARCVQYFNTSSVVRGLNVNVY